MSVCLRIVAGIRASGKVFRGQVNPVINLTPSVVRHLASSFYEHEATSDEEIDPADTFGVYRSTAVPIKRDHRPDFRARHHEVVDKRKATKLDHSTGPKSAVNRSPHNLQECADVQDIFGLLGNSTRFTRLAEDEDCDEEEKKRDEKDRLKRRRPNQRDTMWWHGRQIKKLSDKKKLTEALAYFKRLIEVDLVKPDEYVYSNLIGGCGRAGYTKMAFKLHKQMKERALKIPLAVYTGLFNACGNSPWPENGLRLARKLQAEVETKGILLNSSNYHAAIKAFGRCNDLQMTFRLVDEMIAKKVGVTTATFNFLLVACVSDKKQGFLRTIQVWKRMREKRIKPDIFSFNLLVRAVRDCGLGDPEIAGKLLLTAGEGHPRLEMLINDPPPIAPTLISGSDEYQDEFTNSLVVVQPEGLQLPDLLSPWSNANSVVSLNAAETAHDRLLMLGGCAGILQRMRNCDVNPELKTFTELIEIVPASEESLLIETMDERKVVADVDFFNVLIKKRGCRGDLNGARDVLSLIDRRGLYADVATYGALALGCRRWDDAKQLLEDMKIKGLRTNSKILGAVIKNACQTMNFWYLIDMLNRLKSDEVQVDTRMLQDIEKCVTRTKEFIVKKERAGQKSEISKLEHSFKVFYMSYKKFLVENDVELPEHPWKVYEIDESAKDIKP